MDHSKLICPGDDRLVWRETAANRGWDRDRIIDLLAGGEPTEGSDVPVASWGRFEIVDGSLLSDEQRNEYYAEALLARPKQEIKPIFWTAPGHPTYLGTRVPALFIYDDERLRHVYPCDQSYLGVITIHDFLTGGRTVDAGHIDEATDADRHWYGEQVKTKSRNYCRYEMEREGAFTARRERQFV